jgi:hypothetical protein
MKVVLWNVTRLTKINQGMVFQILPCVPKHKLTHFQQSSILKKIPIQKMFNFLGNYEVAPNFSDKFGKNDHLYLGKCIILSRTLVTNALSGKWDFHC